MSDSGVILLAAGGSTRMGVPKQLLHFRGQPLVRHAAQTALASACGPVLVVIGAQSDRVRGALAGVPVDIVSNPRWREGMGTSIRSGVEAVAARDLAGAVLALADQALVTADNLRRLVATHRESCQPIVASRYAGTLGVPVFFSRAFFPHLLSLAPREGCKGLILEHAAQACHVDCPEAAIDVDTPLDYARLPVI